MTTTYLPATTTDCADCCVRCGDYLYHHRRVGGAVECPQQRNQWRHSPVGRGVFIQYVKGKKGKADAPA